MKKTSVSLFAFAVVCGTFVLPMTANSAEQVVSRTETTYTSQNERIMDGYTPLDEIDNSVKTSTKTYKVPVEQQDQPTVAPAPVAQVAPAHVQGQQIVIQQPAGKLPAEIMAPTPVPNNVCAAGVNCPAAVTSVSYTQSPVKVQYPVVRQYPVSVEHAVTVNRDVTVRQPVVVQQPVVLQKPVVVHQPVMVERAPAYVQQKPVVMQQQASYVQGQPVVVQAPAGQVLPPCTSGNCQ